MDCIKCGKKVSDDSLFCESCGSKVENTTDYQTGYQDNEYQDIEIHNMEDIEFENTQQEYQGIYRAKSDKNHIGFNIISFLVPVVGLFLYLINRKSSPIRAKGIGTWALAGFIVNVIVNSLKSLGLGI